MNRYKIKKFDYQNDMYGSQIDYNEIIWFSKEYKSRWKKNSNRLRFIRYGINLLIKQK